LHTDKYLPKVDHLVRRFPITNDALTARSLFTDPNGVPSGEIRQGFAPLSSGSGAIPVACLQGGPLRGAHVAVRAHKPDRFVV
jgi:hypothetical protein